MTHEVDCPARYGCCPRDLEMSCTIHVEPPCNCGADAELVAYHPTHEMVRNDYGVDIWRYEVGHHNGPECRRCGKWCHHCDSDRAKRPCGVEQVEP